MPEEDDPDTLALVLFDLPQYSIMAGYIASTARQCILLLVCVRGGPTGPTSLVLSSGVQRTLHLLGACRPPGASMVQLSPWSAVGWSWKLFLQLCSRAIVLYQLYHEMCEYKASTCT